MCLFLIYAVAVEENLRHLRLNAFENCLYICLDSDCRLDNHAKLELCPKIKLNKSLFFSLSPLLTLRLASATTIIMMFIYLWQQAEEKYFHDFPLRCYSVVGSAQKIDEECCCVPNHADFENFPSFLFPSTTFYCSPRVYFLFMMLLYGS